jgi:hypothetical protein
MALKIKKGEENIELLTGKKCVFFTAAIFLRGVAGGIWGSCLASGDLGGSWVASGVACGLRGSRVTLGGQSSLGVTDGLVGLQIASRAAGGLIGSWVAMGGRKWPLKIAVDLGGLRVTLIICQIFTNALNLRINLLTQSVTQSVFAHFGMI